MTEDQEDEWFRNEIARREAMERRIELMEKYLKCGHAERTKRAVFWFLYGAAFCALTIRVVILIFRIWRPTQ